MQHVISLTVIVIAFGSGWLDLPADTLSQYEQYDRFRL